VPCRRCSRRACSRHLQRTKGYKGPDSLFLRLAFMALGRLESIESLRCCAPGEWRQRLGPDRDPEVRTLRAKIRLSAQAEWSRLRG